MATTRGKLDFFFQFKLSFMGEFEEEFFHVTSCYCDNNPKARSKFYKAVKLAALDFQKLYKTKRMAIDISFDDAISKKHFSKDGLLTYIELVGNTKFGLKALDKICAEKSAFKFSRMQKKDMNKLMELDLESHILDKTSRMRKIFMKKNARKNMAQFYGALLKNNASFVAKENGKLAGDIAYFVDPKNKWGLVAAIFVAKDFQGRGLSFELYKQVLTEFKKKKLELYIGATTTVGVLASAAKIGRIELKRVYLVKI
ncbi:MAG: GNAT family N-acetyltransferase [Rhizobacter sp.]|nr:GNAT family N-acetyltransferase [Bacteriovorax sp.]